MRRPLILLALVLGLMSCPAPAPGQALRIQSLRVPEDAAPGPWASFHVRTQSRNLPPREFTQRVAVVAAEGIGADAGVWIELTTVDPQVGTRIARGFFTRRSEEEQAHRPADGPRTLELSRLQRLSTDGRLYEYPPGSDAGLRANEEVAMLGLFEISYLRAPTVDTLGTDTLRIGRRELVSRTIRRVWVGSDEWPDDSDSTRIHRALLSLTVSHCDEVPGTGFTRSLFEVRPAAFALADTLAEQPLPPPEGGGEAVFYRAELTLSDLGGGAVPEVTQEAEPAPLAEEPEVPNGPVR